MECGPEQVGIATLPHSPSPVKGSRVRVEVCRDRDGLVALRSEWNALLERSRTGSVFSCWEWQVSWWDIFSGPAVLAILAVRDGGGALIGLTPLMAANFGDGLGPALGFLGGVEVCDYLDILAEPGREAEVGAALLDFVNERGAALLGAGEAARRQLSLHCLPPASVANTVLPELAAPAGFSVERMVEEQCPRIELPGSFEDYLATLSKKDRHELRRKMRRVQSIPNWRLRFTERPEELERDLETFFHLHRQGKGRKAFFMTDEMRTFFRAVTPRMMEKGWLNLAFLEADGITLAATYSFDYRGERLLYNSGYDQEYSGLSAGVVLVGLLIEDSITRGHTAFDFLRGDERYKYDFGAVDRPLYHLRLVAE